MEVDAEMMNLEEIAIRIKKNHKFVSDYEIRCIDQVRKTVLAKEKTTKKSEPVGKMEDVGIPQVLLENLDLIIMIEHCRKKNYNFKDETVLGIYVVSLLDGTGPIPLIVKTQISSPIISSLQSHKILRLTNLKLLSLDDTQFLMSSQTSKVRLYMEYKSKRPTKADCILEGLQEIESIERYRKLLEIKSAFLEGEELTEIEDLLQWRIPASCLSETQREYQKTYKVCYLSRLQPIKASFIGRIISSQNTEDSVKLKIITFSYPRSEGCLLKLKIESVTTKNFILIYVKNVHENYHILFHNNLLVIFKGVEVKLSITGTIYGIINFNPRVYHCIGIMDEKISNKIKDLAMYPSCHISDIIDTCAIRKILKLWVSILQIKHLQLWNACSVCEARIDKADFCYNNCPGSRLVLRGKSIAYIQDGTGKALLFLKDSTIPAAYGLDSEKVEMVKGWIRGQGEFNLNNKNKIAWKEIFSLFGNPCEIRRASILCIPFCKGVTKSREDVESITMPKFLKTESTSDLYINGEIQGGYKLKGNLDICLKLVEVLNEDIIETYYQISKDLSQGDLNQLNLHVGFDINKTKQIDQE